MRDFSWLDYLTGRPTLNQDNSVSEDSPYIWATLSRGIPYKSVWNKGLSCLPALPCYWAFPLLVLEPTSSGFQYGLKLGISLGFPWYSRTRLRQLACLIRSLETATVELLGPQLASHSKQSLINVLVLFLYRTLTDIIILLNKRKLWKAMK